MISPYILLFISIIAEVIATLSLGASQGLTRLGFLVPIIIGYSISFYGLSITLKTLPIGPVYAIWSGVGIMFVTLIGAWLFKQQPDIPAIIGIVLIVVGVMVLTLCSKMKVH